MPGKRNINLEAVQAYYNTNESQNQMLDRLPKTPNVEGIQIKTVGSPTLAAQTRIKDLYNGQVPVHEFQAKAAGDQAAVDTNEPQVKTQNAAANGGTNIINNIMHINHSGANINIMSVPGSQNNFIFNQSAPINLNFYKNGTKNTGKAKIAGSTEDEVIDVNEKT